MLEFDQPVFTVDGVTYSWFETSRDLLDFGLPAPPVSLYDLPGRATRATLAFQPTSLRITANAGELTSRQVSVTISIATQISAASGSEFVSALVESPATFRVQVMHGLLSPAAMSVVVPITASGIPTAFLPVELDLQPGNKFLTVNPRDLRSARTTR